MNAYSIIGVESYGFSFFVDYSFFNAVLPELREINFLSGEDSVYGVFSDDVLYLTSGKSELGGNGLRLII